jgi:hypothetical protein
MIAITRILSITFLISRLHISFFLLIHPAALGRFAHRP